MLKQNTDFGDGEDDKKRRGSNAGQCLKQSFLMCVSRQHTRAAPPLKIHFVCTCFCRLVVIAVVFGLGYLFFEGARCTELFLFVFTCRRSLWFFRSFGLSQFVCSSSACFGQRRTASSTGIPSTKLFIDLRSVAWKRGCCIFTCNVG